MTNDQPCMVEGCTELARVFSYDDYRACSQHSEELGEWQRAVEQAEHVALHGAEPLKQRCPRRVEDGAGDAYNRTGDPAMPDTWSHRSQMAGGIRALHCDYCGSLHPDRFMDLVREGCEVGPTDKSYKVYIHGPKGGMETKFYFQHLSDEQRREFVDLLNEKRVQIGYPGHFYVRPFFVSVAE